MQEGCGNIPGAGDLEAILTSPLRPHTELGHARSLGGEHGKGDTGPMWVSRTGHSEPDAYSGLSSLL